MKAIQVSSTGGPENLHLVDLPESRPGEGQVLVKVRAAAVNFIDAYFRKGQYPTSLPYTPGFEGSGDVVEVGPGVKHLEVGQRIAWGSTPGSYAEYVAVNEDTSVVIPDTISYDDAASLLLRGVTAHYLLNSTFDAQPNDTILVHAGAGGVGLILTQLAVRKGVHVVTTVSTLAKAELSRKAGAQLVLNYSDDIVHKIRDLTEGEGLPVVYDGVGKDTFEISLRALRVRGTLILFGASSGPVPPFDLQRLNGLGSLYVTRPSLGDYTQTRKELLWRTNDLFDAIASNSLHIRVGNTYALEDAAQAHKDLEARLTTGSVILHP